MNCDCGEVMKLVPAGVSRSTGKSYAAFYSCKACGMTKNTERPTISHRPPAKADTNGIDPSMRLAYRKDLMVAIVEKANIDTPGSTIIETFNTLWNVVEK